MSNIYDVTATATAHSVEITANFYISDRSDYRVDLTLYDMDGTAIKRGYSSWTDWTGAPGNREYTLVPDYPLPIATQYRYAVQLSRRDSGTVLDRQEGYVSTRLEYFEWDAQKIRGEDVNITANEWNRLLDKIAAEVAYVR